MNLILRCLGVAVNESGHISLQSPLPQAYLTTAHVDVKVTDVTGGVIGQAAGLVSDYVSQVEELVKAAEIFDEATLATKFKDKDVKKLSTLHKKLDELLQEYCEVLTTLGKDADKDGLARDARKFDDRAIGVSVKWGCWTLLHRIEAGDATDASLTALTSLWGKHSSEESKQSLGLGQNLITQVEDALKKKKKTAAASSGKAASSTAKVGGRKRKAGDAEQLEAVVEEEEEPEERTPAEDGADEKPAKKPRVKAAGKKAAAAKKKKKEKDE